MNKILCFLVFIAPITAFAEINQCSAVPKIFHINGITTSPEGAKQSESELRLLAEEKLGGSVDTFLAYNRTNGFFSDIAQTFYQLQMQDPSTPSEKISEALLNGTRPSEMNERIAEAAISYYQEKQKQSALFQITASEQDEIIQDIKSNIQKGDKILLVPHSQGNLFANSIYSLLTSNSGVKSEDIKIFGVASPADRVLGNGDYITSNKDLVIGGLALLRKVLPSNLEMSFSNSDFLGHGFKEIYLNSAMNGRDEVWKGIERQIEILGQSSDPLYQGQLWEHAPIIVSFYGVPFDDVSVWSEAGYPSKAGATTTSMNSFFASMHTIAPSVETRQRYSIPSVGNYSEQVFTGMGKVRKTIQSQRVEWFIMCQNSVSSNAAKIQNGTYEIHGDYDYYHWKGNRERMVDLPTGFSIQAQGRIYNYSFFAEGQQRSAKYENIQPTGFAPWLSYYGTINLLLGKIQVTQNADTGRYQVVWQPTPELALREIK